ncbi:MAG: hypothetical protein ACE5FY_06015 [Nitrospiria bacterium]
MKRHCFFLLTTLLIPMLVPAEEVVEGIAAVVTIDHRKSIRKVIFLSDLDRYRLFFETPTAIKTSSLDRLNHVINHVLLLSDAKRFILNGPTQASVMARFSLIKKRFKDTRSFHEAIEQTGMTVNVLKELLLEYLWVEQLIQERIKDFIFVGQRAVEDYYRKHPDDFSGRAFEEVEPVIRAILIEEKRKIKQNEYLKRLVSKARIEIILK